MLTQLKDYSNLQRKPTVESLPSNESNPNQIKTKTAPSRKNKMKEPTFPLRKPHNCLLCGKACTLFITQATNPHGRGGRPAYKCFDHGTRGFSTFDDNIGITAGNPRCACTFTSRKERNNTSRIEFYRCPVGQCWWSADVEVTVPPAIERTNFDTGNENGQSGQVTVPPPPERDVFYTGNENWRYEEGRRGCCYCVVM